jgi:hypothetical protein
MKYRSILTHIKRVFIIALILASCCCEINAQIAGVWAVGDGEKVFKYNTEHAAKESNSIWDGERIYLRVLYNEVLGFQVIVEVDSTGARGLQLSMNPPIHQPSDMMIGGSGGIP